MPDKWDLSLKIDIYTIIDYMHNYNLCIDSLNPDSFHENFFLDKNLIFYLYILYEGAGPT